MSKIGEPVLGLWNDKTWDAKYIGEVCQIKWIKLCEIYFKKTTGTAYTLSGNVFVQDSTNGQELEPFAGNMTFKLRSFFFQHHHLFTMFTITVVLVIAC